MNNYLVIFMEKQKNNLHEALLKNHIEYLKKLYMTRLLRLCGPFSDNDGAVFILNAESVAHAESLVKEDPFIKEGYYNKFQIQEFFEAKEENNWLMDHKQTKNNIIYDSIGKGYQNTRMADYRIVEKILNLMDKNTIRKIVDIGAGTGNYSVKLAENGFCVSAVEPSEVMMAQRKNHSNLEFIKAVAEDLPFKNNFFDAAISTLALHHFRDKKTSFGEIYRVLKDSGKIIFFTFDNRIINRNFWMYEYFEDKIEEAKNCMPCKNELISMFQEVGFKNISTYAFPLPENLSDGFLFSSWKYPERYLDQTFLNGISSFAKQDKSSYVKQLSKLKNDLDLGLWNKKYFEILNDKFYDAGYYFIYAEK